jgi:hypothetical protein
MKRSRRPSLETLEDRSVPARFGIPWSDPLHLTLSFAPDGTQVAGKSSNLFATLNAEQSTALWQREVLQAVQAWAANANLSISVVPDGGQPFGTPGLSQGDPRFGDIRIGAQPMSPDVMSISVPHDPYLAGTWSGDILLNSNIDFTAPSSNLYGVMLHELGHVLGLGDNTDPNSVLYCHPKSLPMHLSRGDVANLLALYGKPAGDSSNNHSFKSATGMPYPTAPAGFDGATPLVVFGKLTSSSESDVFSVQTAGYGGAMTFHLQTAGLSLLEPQLIVYDSAGNVLGQAASTTVGGDTITVHLDQVSPNTVYYLRVQAAVKDVFATGRFGLAATFDDTLETSADQLSAVLRGPYETLPAGQIDAIFRNPDQALLQAESSNHGSLASALVLTTSPGYAANRHYEIIDNISGDPAYYRVQAPRGPAGSKVVLTASISALSVHGIVPSVTLLDAKGRSITAQVVGNGEGSYTIQAGGLTPGATYYLQLGLPDYSTETEGNFTLSVDFTQPLQMLHQFASGTLTTTTSQQGSTLYVAQTQLFQFVLSAAAATPGEGVQMTITDASGAVVFSLTALAGQTVSGPGLLLPPGAYKIVFSAVPAAGAPWVPLTYQLSGASLTDPIGPILNNPTLTPMYTAPSGSPSTTSTGQTLYYFPNGVTTTDPFLWVPLVL